MDKRNDYEEEEIWEGIDFGVLDGDITAHAEFTDHMMTSIYKQTAILFWDCPVCKQKAAGKHEDHICNTGGGTASQSSREAQECFKEMLKPGDVVLKKIDERFQEEIEKATRMQVEGYRDLKENECFICGHEYTSNFHINQCRRLKEGKNE